VPDWLIHLFARYGYGVVFAGVMLENAGLPVPGETVLLAGAALSHFGHLSLLGVIACAMTGAILGDNVGFAIGRRGGRSLAERVGPRLGLTTARLRAFDRFVDRHGARTVFIARFVTGLRVLGAALAGASQLPWRSFLFYNATGAVAWATTFGIVGYFLGHSWEQLERWVGRFGLALAALVAAAIVVVWRTREKTTP
jgi:undecaprenyl-diphosphatase